MSRIRSIKPEFWTSEQVMECSPMARLVFIGMWNFCDDQGVHPASAKTLKAEIFPSDDITSQQVSTLVSELIEQGLIVEYPANGKKWWYVTGWRHQLINRPSAPKYPPPPTHQKPITEHSLSTQVVLIDRGDVEEREDVDVDVEKERERARQPENSALTGGTLDFFKITPERLALAAQQGHTDPAWVAEQTLRFVNHHRTSPPSPKGVEGVWLNWLRKGRAYEVAHPASRTQTAEHSRRVGFFAAEATA